MAIDFPNTPTVGQQFIAAGIAWSWDGSKWVNATNVPSGYAPLNSPPFTGNPTAPTPPYGDNDTSLATTAFVQSAVAPALNNVGRNLLHNPLFNVAQRGVGPFAFGYSLDRWFLALSGDTPSITQTLFSDAQRTQIGDEEASVCLYNTFTGTAAATAFTVVQQRIENVRRLGGKIVTVSFLAFGTASLKLGVSIDQSFGTGGSPSTPVLGNGTAITITTTPARYTVSFTVPSISGKTIGTNADNHTGLNFWYSTGANASSRSGGIGVQSGIIALWGVQLEVGSVATPLEKPDPQQDLAKCQRFYEVGQFQLQGWAGVNGTVLCNTQTFSVSKRATTTVTPFNTTLSAATLAVDSQAPNCFRIILTATAAPGIVYAFGGYTASADL